MNLIVWIIFGGLAGWVATMIMGENARFGVIGNIIIGIIGAWIGGWLAPKFGFGGVTGFDIRSFIVAVIGSIVLLFILSFFQRRTI
jgi:uncharacterized membrane protein YeaQ/YmgE (transglycosylase-associated protein family)